MINDPAMIVTTDPVYVGLSRMDDLPRAKSSVVTHVLKIRCVWKGGIAATV